MVRAPSLKFMAQNIYLFPPKNNRRLLRMVKVRGPFRNLFLVPQKEYFGAAEY